MSTLHECGAPAKGGKPCTTLTRRATCPVHDPEKVLKRWAAVRKANARASAD